MSRIQTFLVQFANEITFNEIPKFRGAVIASLERKNILYHNHTDTQFRYAYPLIQYKRIHKKAAIVCVGDGVKAIHELFATDNFMFNIGNKLEEMKMEYTKAYDNDVSISDTQYLYRIQNWLPLNSENYLKFQGTDNLVDKIQMLERLLVGNILSFLKGVGIYIEERLELRITNIVGQRPAVYKKVRMMAFDVEFYANIHLPQHIGIGKNASVGYGTLTKIKS